ncbi:MAG: hypothetical protein ACOYM0_01100 [Bacteroidales bacterium]
MTKNSNLAITITRIFYTYPNIPVAITNHVDRFHKDIEYDSGQTLWTEIYATRGSASFEEKEKENDAGVLFEQKLKFIYPGENDTDTLLFDLARRPVIVKIIFNKGLPKMFGSAANPAKLERLLKTSAKDSASECIFSCMCNEPAWWIYSENPSQGS